MLVFAVVTMQGRCQRAGWQLMMNYGEAAAGLMTIDLPLGAEAASVEILPSLKRDQQWTRELAFHVIELPSCVRTQPRKRADRADFGRILPRLSNDTIWAARSVVGQKHPSSQELAGGRPLSASGDK
jgi:hypothetical protein